MSRRSLLSMLVLVGLAGVPSSGYADGGQEAESARLVRTRETERYSVAWPGHSIKAGGAMVAVDAPFAEVRKIVTDFGRYADFMPRFERSRIVRKSKEGVDVYLQVPILRGAATVWAVTRFEPPIQEGRGQRIEGRMTDQGNVRDLRAVWHLHPIDENRTLLKLELLIVPKLPLPASVVTPELEYAAAQAVTASRERAETRAKAVAKDER